MGFLQRVSTVVRAEASSPGDPFHGLYGAHLPPEWYGQMAGVGPSPELAMTLTAMYAGVTMIADDVATMPCQIFQYLDNGDGGKRRARQHPLAYPLRWQPNQWQTAKEFWSMEAGHFVLRGVAYAEIVEGPGGFADQLIPRHPDRVRAERLPSGRLRYVLRQVGQEPRTLTQDQMFVFRDTCSDAVQPMSRIAYGMRALSAAITQERFTHNFFRKGATAALVATHKGGELDEEESQRLHASIGRYLNGVENAGGLLIIEDDMEIKDLGLDLEKAQLAQLKDASVKDIARLLKMPGHKLEANQQTQAYSAREQANLEYVIGCLRPIVIGIEQAIQRDLILAPDTYFAEFLIDALLRGDLKARADYYSKAIAGRWMWPSEVRMIENMNPDPVLDELSKRDRQPGSPNAGRSRDDDERADTDFRRMARAERRVLQFARAGAERVLHKELEQVSKAAERYASDVDGWKAWLQDFYGSHARFTAQVLCVPIETARAYAAGHGSQLRDQGVGVLEEWKATGVDALTALALEVEERSGRQRGWMR